MEPSAILDQLIKSEDLPREALRAATERRAEMVPLLVAKIESYIGTGEVDPTAQPQLFFIFHLLGTWQEAAAYRSLARMLRCHPEDVEAAIGGAITETAHKIMAAVFDGDPQPLHDIILDEGADEYVRSRMCETLAMLVLQGRLGREETAAFLRDCWVHLQPRNGCFVWHGWQSAIAMLGLIELKDVVREAFAQNIVHSEWLAFSDFESDLQHAIANPTQPWPTNPGEFAPFGDAVEELSTWYCFSDKYKRERERERNAPPHPETSLFRMAAVMNPLRGIGRNDPCPCGSGKKYKKCCLN